jgi:hypothetical protein
MINPSSIKWFEPLIMNTPKIPKNLCLSTSRIEEKFDPDTIPEIEQEHPYWVSYDNFEKKQKHKFDFFMPHLKLESTFCCGAMKTISKMMYTCVGAGIVPVFE